MLNELIRKKEKICQAVGLFTQAGEVYGGHGKYSIPSLRGGRSSPTKQSTLQCWRLLTCTGVRRKCRAKNKNALAMTIDQYALAKYTFRLDGLPQTIQVPSSAGCLKGILRVVALASSLTLVSHSFDSHQYENAQPLSSTFFISP